MLQHRDEDDLASIFEQSTPELVDVVGDDAAAPSVGRFQQGREGDHLGTGRADEDLEHGGSRVTRRRGVRLSCGFAGRRCLRDPARGARRSTFGAQLRQTAFGARLLGCDRRLVSEKEFSGRSALD